MGRIAKILSFIRTTVKGAKVSDVKTNAGGGANITAQHFANAGDDSFPLLTDYALSVGVEGSGKEATAGYLDPVNPPKATAGEKRIYARDANTGLVVVEVWLKSDSSAIISNENGTITLQADGEVNINGARITTGGNVITASGVSLDNHPHNQGADSAGDTQQATDAPTATE